MQPEKFLLIRPPDSGCGDNFGGQGGIPALQGTKSRTLDLRDFRSMFAVLRGPLQPNQRRLSREPVQTGGNAVNRPAPIRRRESAFDHFDDLLDLALTIRLVPARSSPRQRLGQLAGWNAPGR